MEQFIELIKTYDFKKNSMRQFSKKYCVNVKTIKKYLINYKIDFNSKSYIIKNSRDSQGKFTINFEKINISKNKNQNLIEFENSNQIKKLTKNQVSKNISYEDKIKRIQSSLN